MLSVLGGIGTCVGGSIEKDELMKKDERKSKVGKRESTVLSDASHKEKWVIICALLYCILEFTTEMEIEK
jgi:hypothetical protein